MKMHDAKQTVAKLNMTITKDSETQEYRVTFARHVKGYETAEAREAVAYYTDDLQDAVGTARMMHAYKAQTMTLAESQVYAMHKFH
jgi:hypothetical protein